MNRLRAFRLIENINQENLGELLELSPQMVSAIEAGRRPFHGDLERLGYASDRFALPDMSEPMHRQKASTRVASRNRAKELIRLAGEVFAALREVTPTSPDVAIHRLDPPMSVDDIEDAAYEARFMLDHEPAGPIRNLTAAVERAGVCLIPIVGLDGIDGLSSWVGEVPVIGVSPSVPGDRFRLTLGHELGHLMLHRSPGSTIENEANQFAGALLIPRPEFDAAMPERPQLRDFVNLKSAWGVSIAALVYRAHELDYIDDKRYRALQIQMSKWRKVEPGLFEPVHGRMLAALVEANGGVRSVAANLGVNSEHLSELLNWNHLRLA